MNKTVKWISNEDAQERHCPNKPAGTNAVIEGIESMLDKAGLMNAYRKALHAAGGKSCTGADKIKLAAHVYFGGAKTDKEEVFVKKPMKLLKDSEKIDVVRDIGIKKWGDVKKRTERSLITDKVKRDWRSALYPAPTRTVKGAKAFKQLSMDDRMKWVRHFEDLAPRLESNDKDRESAYLKAMEYACSRMGIKVFTGPERSADYISFVVEEYADMMTLSDITGALRFLESQPIPTGITHDVKIRKIDLRDAVRALVPTMKAMQRWTGRTKQVYDLYKEYSRKVASVIKTDEDIPGERNLAIAHYLINKYHKHSIGIGNLSEIPDILTKAFDPRSTESTRGLKKKIGVEVQVDGRKVLVMPWESGTEFTKEDIVSMERRAIWLLKGLGIVDVGTVRKVVIVPGTSVNIVGCKKLKKKS